MYGLKQYHYIAFKYYSVQKIVWLFMCLFTNKTSCEVFNLYILIRSSLNIDCNVYTTDLYEHFDDKKASKNQVYILKICCIIY
jgi:hypothetical protein